MDLETVIIGIFSLALFVVPIIFINKKQKAKKLMLLQDFTAIAKLQQLTIEPYEFWDPYYAIGLDTEKKKLLYTRNVGGVEQQVFIDLMEVSNCRVVILSRDANDSRIIDRIDLAFTFRNSKRPEKTLEFYSKEVSLNLSDELRLSEKWKKLVNDNIATTAASATSFVLAK